ncbi:MAG: site-specific integrase [Coriobacteriaceae bacterium]|nr:site-specific integrase [Coriobacteriaceae bacterium]
MGTLTTGPDMPFSDYARAWLDGHLASGYICEATAEKDRHAIEAASRHLGSLPIGAISADDLAGLVLFLRTQGARDGRGLSGTTSRTVYLVVRQVLSHAALMGHVGCDPCAHVRPPVADTDERVPLAPGRARALADALVAGAPSAVKAAGLLALSCGLRRGEACALRWDDVDLAIPSVTVSRAVSGPMRRLRAPKSRAGRMTVPVPPGAATALSRWRREQGGGDFVVGGHAAADPCRIGKGWSAWAEGNGFPGATLHVLRHTYATLLCAGGADIVTAASLMGHSGTAMLSRVYAHRVDERVLAATRGIGSALF